MGKSRGGLAAKLMAAVDRRGVMVTFLLVPGNAAASPQSPGLPADINMAGVDDLIGDKACDTDGIRAMLREMGIAVAIPGKSNRKVFIPYDQRAYKGRHPVENAFADISRNAVGLQPGSASMPTRFARARTWPFGTVTPEGGSRAVPNIWTGSFAGGLPGLASSAL